MSVPHPQYKRGQFRLSEPSQTRQARLRSFLLRAEVLCVSHGGVNPFWPDDPGQILEFKKARVPEKNTPWNIARRLETKTKQTDAWQLQD